MRRSFLLAAGLAFMGRRLLARSREEDLSGQVVLITGGSRGLGLLMAREFGRRGCKLAICARDRLELSHAVQDLREIQPEVLSFQCDVSRRDEVERMVDQVTAHYGRIDILVNNAGIIQVGPLETMTVEDFEEILAINFLACVYTTLAVLPQMRQRRYGRIITIDSIGGRVPAPHMIPYDAAKFALRGFSHGLHIELEPHGIRVTTVVPGLMRTGSPVNAFFKGQHAKEFTWFSIADSLPLLTMDAERAAECIVAASARGAAEITLTGRAKLLGLAHGVFPQTTLQVLGWANRMLPGAVDGDRRMVRGMELATRFAPSPITRWMNEAAKRYNQYGGQPQPSPAHARQAQLESAREPVHDTLSVESEA